MSNLEEIKQRIDIISFIGEYVTLKKAGRNFKGLCPFHSEKSPSFIVSPERQIWHCFGACSEGGDIFTFLMKVESLEFPEALEILAKKAGVRLTREYRVTEGQKLKEEIYKANRYASNFFHYLLMSHKVGEKAREYLKERKVNTKVIETFSLGYAPENWESLIRFLRKKDFNDYVLTKAGLVVSSRSGKLYDRFRGRLIFTLRDHRGNVVGFSGRKLPHRETADREAKYINTQETPVYIKGNVLYGLDVTKDSIRKSGEAIIVEGEFDLISSFQTGITNIVAIKGTALTVNQVNLLKRFTETISLSLDSDVAGDAAARRGIEIAENAGLDIKVIQVPFGKDPDECIKENPGQWKKAVNESIPVYDFLLQSTLRRYDKNKAFDKRKIVDELIPFYGRISNTIVQSHYLSLLSKTIEVPLERLLELVEKVKKGRQIGFTIPKAAVKEGKARNLLLEEYLLSLLLQAPSISQITQTISKEDISQITTIIDNPALKKIITFFYEWVTRLKEQKPHTSEFIKTLSEELISYADTAYLLELGGIPEDKTRFRQQLLKIKHDLLSLYFRRKLRELSTKIKEVKNEKAFAILNNEFISLKESLKALDTISVR